MAKIILFHGTCDEVVTPTFGRGEDKHDYGRGFYLTESLELAKEWAVCVPNETNGWAHKYELDTGGLNIIDIEILEELLSLGGLGIQYCIKSERAYARLHEVKNERFSVPYEEFNERYNLRGD